MNIGLVRRGWLSIMGNYFQYVSLVSLYSKGALHCDKIHETHPQPMTEPPPNGTVSWIFLGCFLDVPGSIRCTSMPPNTYTSICDMKKKPAFVRPMEFSPRPKIPISALLALDQNKRDFLCLGISIGDLIGPLALYPVVLSRLRTVLVDKRLLGNQRCFNSGVSTPCSLQTEFS